MKNEFLPIILLKKMGFRHEHMPLDEFVWQVELHQLKDVERGDSKAILPF